MPRIAQVAMCSADIPRSVQLYSEAFGFADSGIRALWGERVARIQGLGGDAAFLVQWLVGRQDFVQLEFFHHTTPVQRRQPADWRPSDLGWVRYGIAVPDFDASLERLARLGVRTVTEPLSTDGLRRVCFRDPYVGIMVEVMEEGPALPGGIRPRHYDLVPAVVYVALSVPALGPARTFFVDTLGLEEAEETQLHRNEHEALWGLDGARRDTLVIRGGDVYLELVHYHEPVGRPKVDGDRLSDQGFMNVAVGFRDVESLQEVYARVVAAGYRDNASPSTVSGGTYVNDSQGITVELLLMPRELDESFGFTPRPELWRTPSWPRPSTGPARASISH
jgi:catechol 2,3-dioxygenase-like lactoylglutathione lyase family enzyme